MNKKEKKKCYRKKKMTSSLQNKISKRGFEKKTSKNYEKT